MTIGFSVRLATPQDAVKIRNLHIASIRKICSADYSQDQIDAWSAYRPAERYRKAMADGEIMFVAEKGSQIIGFAAFHSDKINAVYVRPGHTGLGVGAALLKTVEQQMRNSAISTAKLSSSLTAKQFYLAHGWQNTGETVYELRSGTKIPCIGMTKDL